MVVGRAATRKRRRKRQGPLPVEAKPEDERREVEVAVDEIAAAEMGIHCSVL